MTIHNDSYIIENCPACGEPGDYCLGHGMIGDPVGYAVLMRHDSEDHTMCHASAPCVQLTPKHFVAAFLMVVVLLGGVQVMGVVLR